MLRSKTIFAILLALSFLSNRAQGDKKLEFAEEFLSRHKVIDYAEESASLTQIGNGSTIVSEIRSVMRVEGSWFCAIKANKNRLKNIGKVYIPKSYRKYFWTEELNLWDEGEEAIRQYLVSMAFVTEPYTTLRFSWVKGTTNGQMQMLIPTTVVNDASLGLWAQCFDSVIELGRFSNEAVNWGDRGIWDIRGTLGTPGP